jgi:hypothetical protein
LQRHLDEWHGGVHHALAMASLQPGTVQINMARPAGAVCMLGGAMPKNLSAVEAEVLLWLQGCWDAVERDGSERQRTDMRRWGMPWDGTIGSGPVKAVSEATLRRLESRGFVRRTLDERSWDRDAEARYQAMRWAADRWDGRVLGSRATHVLLTAAGRYAALDLRRMAPPGGRPGSPSAP